MALTDVRIRQAKGADRPYKLPDGGGLHLYVTPAGAKLWRWRYERAGREKLVSLGSYPAMSLREAREARDAMRREVRTGLSSNTPGRRAPTLRDLIRDWHAVQAPRWKPHHAADVIASLDREIMGELGERLADDISPPELLAVLRPLEQRGAIDTAHRIRQRVESAYAFGIAAGAVRTNPAAAVRAAMAPMPAKGHRPAMLDLESARAALRAAEATPAMPVTLLALRLLALTATRPGEVRGAAWREFEGLDGSAPLWRIPADRMKTHREHTAREHVVPLARQAVEVIRAVRVLTGRGPLAFPSHRSAHKPISENAMGYLLNRAGLYGRHVPHGWRATFSTVMNERYPADRAIIDLMLAHAPRDQVEAAYNRARHMQRRRELAQLWADMLMEGMLPPTALIGL